MERSGKKHTIRETTEEIWNHDMRLTLIALYKKNNHLWDRKSPGYGKMVLRENTHKQMGQQLDVSAIEVKLELGKMRIKFKNNLKKVQRFGYEAARIFWPYYDPLRFLQGSFLERKPKICLCHPRANGRHRGKDLCGAVARERKQSDSESERDRSRSPVNMAPSNNAVVKYEKSPAGPSYADDCVDGFFTVVGNLVKKNKKTIHKDMGRMGFSFTGQVAATPATRPFCQVIDLTQAETKIDLTK